VDPRALVEPGVRRAPGWPMFGLAGLLAAALLAWAGSRVDLSAVAAELGRVEIGWVAVAALGQVLALAWRGVRWRALLRRAGRVPLGEAVAATYMGWVALALLPLRIGELARPWLLARRHPVDRSYAFGALQLERLFDVGCVLVLLVLYLHAEPAPGSAAGSGPLLAALTSAETLLIAFTSAAVAALGVAVALAPRLAAALAGSRLVGPAGSRRGRLVRRARAFAGGLTAIRSPGALLAAVGHSLGLWTLVCASHWSLFRAFRLELPALAVGPLLAFVVLGSLIPTPAAVGSYHAAVQVALGSLLGLPLATASGYAVVGHAAAYLPNLALGALLWLLLGRTTRREDGARGAAGGGGKPA
jgi:uncharacterized protein (TIRG00374 family)